MILTAPAHLDPRVQTAYSLRYRAGPLFYVEDGDAAFLFTASGLHLIESDPRPLLREHFRIGGERYNNRRRLEEAARTPLIDIGDIDLGI